VERGLLDREEPYTLAMFLLEESKNAGGLDL